MYTRIEGEASKRKNSKIERREEKEKLNMKQHASISAEEK